MKISPIKIAFEFEPESASRTVNNGQLLLFIVILGLLGAVLNSYPIELAYNISLLIGNFAYIVAAAYLRPSLTLIVALISTAPLLFVWGHPFGFITFGLEALFVATLRSKGWFLPTADLLYWLVIGMPLTALMIWYNNVLIEDYVLFSIFKQSINAIFYTAIAVIVILLFSERLKTLVFQQPPLMKNLRQYLHHIMWTMSAFFVVGVCLLLSRNLSIVQQQLFEQELDTNSEYISRIVDNYVDEHRRAISLIAEHLSSIDDEQYSTLLAQHHENFSGFITMLIANADGFLSTASPLSLLDKVPPHSLNVADRPYFSHAFFQQKLFVSSVFLGRGFGSDPIIAISAPIYGDDKKSPVGIVEGSLNLNMFEHINIMNKKNIAKVDVVIVDENNTIIYSDERLKLKTLSEFHYRLGAKKKNQHLMMLENDKAQIMPYLFRQTELKSGWKVYSLAQHRQLLALIEQQYLTIFVSLFVIFTFVVLLANQFANVLNRPLAFAIKELTRSKSASKDIPYEAPEEFVTLYHELQKGKHQLLEQQQVLEQTVAKRTKALNRANRALKSLADTDSLTGLSNRRHLDIRFKELQAILARNHSKMLVAMLDLDHFKRLNDNLGHIFGDHCLVELAKLMREKFDRRSDIVARFGGEEFVIITQYDEQVLEKFEQLRLVIAEHELKVGQQSTHMTISMGIFIANAEFSNDIDRWVKQADKCLYNVKSTERNNIYIKQK